MEYRKLPKGTEEISVIGLGCGYIDEAPEKEIVETIEAAYESGINFLDCAASAANPFSPYGTALQGIRKNMYLQVHFGANYETGEYGWTTSLSKIQRSVEWQLKCLKTDYIDFGFIHCIDQKGDLDRFIRNGVLDLMQSLKSQGVIRHIALSTHTPKVAGLVLDMGLIDLMMFSINPAYDYRHGEYAIGSTDERATLYRRCAAQGVGISVMKPFDGGILLDASRSPYGKALTQYQCIQYALDKPGVLTVLPGIRGKQDLAKLLGYFNASPAERDYSILGSFTPKSSSPHCVYCGHCAPCPQGLDVALINKYYDLSLAGDAMARGHYMKLETKASACTQCGHCDLRCPFSVSQTARMKEIREYFGE
ncbi:MAG: aldo/keto reductase [Clostridia bacterium]|nr:aldo/keto reductase [Clostridia bacterium]